jgi:hypothetical protein
MMCSFFALRGEKRTQKVKMEWMMERLALIIASASAM